MSVLLLFSLCSCATKDNKTVISYSAWGSENEIKILKPLIREFELENPDIKLNFIHIQKNYFQKLHLLLASNLAPDVIFLNNINLPVYTAGDKLLNLSPYLNHDRTLFQSDFFPEAIESLKYKNKQYAIPRDISNIVIYYNKDLFDKYKVPYPDKNWDFNHFLAISSKLTRDNNNDGKIDIFGVGFEVNPIYWMPFLWSNSGGIINTQNGKIILNKNESINSIQFYADLQGKHHVAPRINEAGSATMTQIFLQQKIAMQISGRWSTPTYRKNADFHWDIAKFPRGKAGSVVSADCSGWAISKSSKHKDKAWRFIKFLAEKKSMQKFTESGLIIPARKEVAYSEVFLDKNPPENAEIFLEAIHNSVSTPVNENYNEISDSINSALEPVWNGSMPANEAINQFLLKKIEKIL